MANITQIVNNSVEANLSNITSIAQDATNNFSFVEAQSVLMPLVFFTIGVVVYSVFIFTFYRFIARKNIFKIDISKYKNNFIGVMEKVFSIAFYIGKYLILFPLVIFAWFFVISLVLIVLSDKQDITHILVTAMALIASIRITAYYDEDLSKDLAKMFPFAVLAVFLLDTSVLSFDLLIGQLNSLIGLWRQMLYYLLFITSLEFVLRIGYTIFRVIVPEEKKDDDSTDDKHK